MISREISQMAKLRARNQYAARWWDHKSRNSVTRREKNNASANVRTDTLIILKKFFCWISIEELFYYLPFSMHEKTYTFHITNYCNYYSANKYNFLISNMKRLALFSFHYFYGILFYRFFYSNNHHPTLSLICNSRFNF